jgi:hypothetical protein
LLKADVLKHRSEAGIGANRVRLRIDDRAKIRIVSAAGEIEEPIAFDERFKRD